MYQLRGHHLFCLLGYRGMGYSKEYIENMTKIHRALRENPKTLVRLVNGPDHLCEKYPNSGEYHCKDQDIFDRDAVILEKLGLHIGDILSWEDIEKSVKQHVIPRDIGLVCETCSWRSYGVCEEGVQRITTGVGLWEVK